MYFLMSDIFIIVYVSVSLCQDSQADQPQADGTFPVNLSIYLSIIKGGYQIQSSCTVQLSNQYAARHQLFEH